MQTDNYSQSRYLLTFSSAEVCKEWWTLIQSEYPDQGTRHGPQLFSFRGDNFPSMPSSNKKFEHLNTRWFYTQFGDATGTGGRHQDIIPLQNLDGQVFSGAGSVGSGSKQDLGQSKDGETDQTLGGEGAINASALREILQTTQTILEKNNEQIAQLAKNQTQGQERMERMEKLFERSLQTLTESQLKSQQQSRELEEENAKQLQDLVKSNVKVQQQNQELSKENGKLLRELQNQRSQQQQSAQTPGKSKTNGEVKQAPSPIQCSHDVHPPPRKIDKKLVGFAYGQDPPKRVNPKGGKQPDTPKNELVLTNR